MSNKPLNMKTIPNHQTLLNKLFASIILVFVTPFIGVGQDSTVQDFDGNTYPATQIGEQVWMAGNLKVTHFNNGVPLTKYPPDLPETASFGEWALWNKEHGETPQYQNSEFEQETGLLYNPYVIVPSNKAQESLNVCPTGWHVPTQENWDQLIEALGGRLVAGVLLKSESGWEDDENGNNETGFNAQPGFDNSHYGPGLQVIWWATMGSRGLVSHETLSDMSDYDGSGMIMNRFGELEESQRYYIRCVKD